VRASETTLAAENTIRLMWDRVTTGHDGSLEHGSIDYRVYCDESFDFAPGPGTLLATTSDLSYTHTDSRIGDPAVNLFYLVTAVDGSGNESAVSNMVGEFDRALGAAK
jgi:fibronectin type 3 domain-containing protein